MGISPESLPGIEYLKLAVEAIREGEANLAADFVRKAHEASPELKLISHVPELMDEVDPRKEPEIGMQTDWLEERHVDLSVPKAAIRYLRDEGGSN